MESGADDPPRLTGAERGKLRSLAQTLDPKVFVGKAGVNAGIAKLLTEAFRNADLVKVRFTAERDEMDRQSQELATLTESEVIGSVGRTATFFKLGADAEYAMDAELFQSRHEAWIRCAETALRRLTPPATVRPARLHEAMRYSLEAGGKRLRPVLCLAAAAAFDPRADAAHAATALECVHTYSLIHDDLPCMDDSDLRRGRPSCHVSFDEATALLAGDALQPLAFELLAVGYADRPALATALVRELAVAAGSTLLVGGQTEDIDGKENDADRIEFILSGKTAAMLSASLAMGALVGGASAADVEYFRRAGRAAGIAFQLVDDLLDLTADADQLGKPAGADAEKGKSTFTEMHGVEETRRRVERLTTEAVAALRATKGDTAFLVELVRRMAARRT